MLGPIEALRAEWEVLRRTPEAHRALCLLSTTEPSVAELHAQDLADVVRAMRPERPPCGVDARTLVRVLLRSQPLHPLVGRALLQAIVPGLVGVARRLSWGSGGDLDERQAFLADVIATAWEVMVEWSGQDRPYAVLDLLSAVRCRVRRRLARERSVRRMVRDQHDTEAEVETPCNTSIDEIARSIDELGGPGLTGDVSATYPVTLRGSQLTVSATWSQQTDLVLTLRCAGAQQTQTGSTGLSVSLAAPSGAGCSVTLALPNGSSTTTSYSLEIDA
jgi:hypothetical protein